jgi:hypothetical protein
VLIGPDQVAAFWHQWNHVVETAGTAAIAGDVAERGHRVVLNAVSNRMILSRRALVSCSELKGASSVLPKSMRGSETAVRRHGRKSSKRGSIGIRIQYNLHIHLVHDMF